MPRNTMNVGWLASALTGFSALTAIGAGAYLSGRYNAQRTWSAYQQAQGQPESSKDEKPTNQHDQTNTANTTGKERDSTWSSTGDTIFAFGDQGRYFLAYRTEPHGTNWFLKTISTNYGIVNTGLKERMSRPYFYAWTSTGDELIGYMDSITDKPTWQFRMDPYRPATAPTYTSLLHWLNENVNTKEEMLQTKIVFGAKSTYFAQNGKKCTYHDLPPTLHNFMLQKKYAISDPAGENPRSWIPRIVALGPDNTFVALWHDGAKLASLSNTPSIAPLSAELSKTSDEKSPSIPVKIYENIVLSPFNAASFFSIKKTGHVGWSIASDESHLDLTVQVGLYSQVRAKEDGTTFNVCNSTSQGVTREVDITPETEYSAEEIRAALTKSGTVEKVRSGIVDRVKALIW